MNKKLGIKILQPLIPHYRKWFFKGINRLYPCSYYCYENSKESAKSTFSQSNIEVKQIKKLVLGPFLVFSPLEFVKKDTRILVLMLHIGHITTWMLLLTKFIHKKKIVVWGHGISVHRYLNESKKPSIFLKWQMELATQVWLYTEKEKQVWANRIAKPEKLVALNNTISGVERILDLKLNLSKAQLKANNGILLDRVCIFSARFTLAERRADLLKIIVDSCPEIGFIIIGDGPYKPDFSSNPNVYDYGSLYDNLKKDELFSIADIYLQPAWLGLSIVEAMAYGLPVFTLKRTTEIKQCVEYFYLEESNGGLICENVGELVQALKSCEESDLFDKGRRARAYVAENLLMDNMVNSAVRSLKSLES